MKPVVRAAIAALETFGITRPDQAIGIIVEWPRYDELSDADLIEVVWSFEPPCGRQDHTGSEDHQLIHTDTLGNG